MGGQAALPAVQPAGLKSRRGAGLSAERVFEAVASLAAGCEGEDAVGGAGMRQVVLLVFPE